MALDFQVYREGERLNEFVPRAAVAIGPEGIPKPGHVRFVDGLLRVDGVEDSTGVALLWNCDSAEAVHSTLVEPVGSQVLETTRLPLRPEPYHLVVELARARLMRLVQKQEDWNLFDFPGAEPLNARRKAAQGTLARAVAVQHDDPVEAARLAETALSEAVRVGESMAEFHADLLLSRRRANGGLPRAIYGVRVDPAVRNTKYLQVAGEAFDYVVLPMGWKRVQPEEELFLTDGIDEFAETLARRRVPLIAGPLIDLDDDSVPEWMFIWEHDFETLRDLTFEYIDRVATRYRRAVNMWNVVAGVHSTNAFGLTFEQMIELTRMLVTRLRAVVPGARTMVTIRQPFGEYQARPGTGVPPLLYAELLAQSGAGFDAFGLELEIGVPSEGRYTRDLFQVSCLLDKFAGLGKPVYITALGTPGRSGSVPDDASRGTLDPKLAGSWHTSWDQRRQADWLAAVSRVAMSKPFVESVAWSNLADQDASLPAGGLLDDLLRPKPVFHTLQRLREERRSASASRRAVGESATPAD